MVSSDHFRHELREQIKRAAARGAKHVVINARELHCALGDFLGPKHQPKYCDVMEQEMAPGDVVTVAETDPTGLTIRYLLPRKR
jgi:ribosomal protein S17